MSFKTILVEVNDSRHLAPRIEAAAHIAMAHDAHLIGLAITGVTKFVFENMTLAPDASNIVPYMEMLRERADNALEEFDRIVSGLGLRSFEKRVTDDEATRAMSLQGRYCDLLVVGQPDPNEDDATIDTGFPEYVVLTCGAPVLMIPYAGIVASVGDRALIAWNASPEAAHAVHAAIPLLQRMQLVKAAIFNPGSQPPEVFGMPPGEPLKAFLAQHNITAEIMTPAAANSVGDTLLSLATDQGFSLLVMGCYGHSRMRELLLGGTTRTILRSATLPVLMMH
jgi:nucleotide-binding universal stress UspA family protein